MISTLKHKSQEIQVELDKLYPNEELIYDGILDYEKYTAAKYRIMWVLKEPYDHFDENGTPYGGGWHFRDAILPKKIITDFDKGSRNTFEPMIYATYSILNGFPDNTSMPYIKEKPVMIDALKSIAYINVKKTPGYTTTLDNVLWPAYEKNRRVLENQILNYDPHIIIFGNTFKYFSKDLGIIPEEMEIFDSFRYSFSKNRLFIDAKHPGQRGNKADYVNELIWICQKNEKQFLG